MAGEQEARAEIDRLLTAAGWRVQDAKAANLTAALGVAIREFPLKDGHGFADYMLYVDGKAVGILELIVDQWNPEVRGHRFETFCYGSKSCPAYRAGPTRKARGRKGDAMGGRGLGGRGGHRSSRGR